MLRCFIYAVPVVPVSPGLLVQQVYGLGGIALRGQQTCVFVPVDRGQVIVVVCRSSIQLGLGLFAEALRLINAIIGCLYFVLHALRTHGIADGQGIVVILLQLDQVSPVLRNRLALLRVLGLPPGHLFQSPTLALQRSNVVPLVGFQEQFGLAFFDGRVNTFCQLIVLCNEQSVHFKLSA